MKVLVAGATGGTGQRIVQVLRDRHIACKALVRDREAALQILPSDLELAIGDVLSPATLTAALADCTVLISATGAKPSFNPLEPYLVDYVGNKNLIDAAKAQGIEQFVMVSSMCVSKLFHPLNLFWLILWWKQQAEQYVQASGVPYTIIRPGGLRNEDTSENVKMQGADTLFEGSIPRMKVAQLAVEALSTPAARNQIVEVIATEDAPPLDYAALFASVASA